MKYGDKVVSWAGMDEICDCCNKPATWRARAKTGNIIGAACTDHKDKVRTALIAKLTRV